MELKKYDVILADFYDDSTSNTMFLPKNTYFAIFLRLYKEPSERYFVIKLDERVGLTFHFIKENQIKKKIGNIMDFMRLLPCQDI